MTVLPFTVIRFCSRNFASVGQHPLGHHEFDAQRLVTLWIWAPLDQPIGEAGFNVFECQIFELANEHPQMAAHRTEHAQCKFRLPPKQRQNAILLHEQCLSCSSAQASAG